MILACIFTILDLRLVYTLFSNDYYEIVESNKFNKRTIKQFINKRI